ncbi:BTB/POZ domain-containing protein 2 isoform X2 [Folsomia candida]|uniref:BTB/POZ domain-containing protein 2 isoform X2 n=1 Tax=Folsomia candida TaxID=158441 RepID=UPI0016055CE5|nr:BTB/POZ domain-containing protein 2 isoform X2 [Folsomia candida]
MEYFSAKSLTAMMSRVLENGLFSDVVLLIGPEEYSIKAHKMVLAGRSTVFEAMLQSRWTEQQDEQDPDTMVRIRLPDHEVDSFKIFIRYLYTGKFPSTDDHQMLAILKLAHLYDVADLLGELVSRLGEKLDRCEHGVRIYTNLLLNCSVENCDLNTVTTCLSIYTSSRFIDTDLSQKSFQIFLKNVRTAGAENRYLSWDAETVRELLNQESLNIREVDLFRALLEWGKQSKKFDKDFPNSEALTELLKLIRFPIIGQQDFAAVVVPTGALPQEEVLAMFLHFSDSSKFPCSFNEHPRNGSSDVYLYPGGIANPNSVVKRFVDYHLEPEISLKVNVPLLVNGVRIFSEEINQIVEGGVRFKLCVTNNNGFIQARGDYIYIISDNSTDVVIMLEPALLLHPGEVYSFQVTCTPFNKKSLSLSYRMMQTLTCDFDEIWARTQNFHGVQNIRIEKAANVTITYHKETVEASNVIPFA